MTMPGGMADPVLAVGGGGRRHTERQALQNAPRGAGTGGPAGEKACPRGRADDGDGGHAARNRTPTLGLLIGQGFSSNNVTM